MSLTQAQDYFQGVPGGRRLNCCQAVLKAFQEEFSLSDILVAHGSVCGGGRAPAGCCGALHALRLVAGQCCPDKLGDFETAFIQSAGSTQCREIRHLRKLSCAGCVEKAAQILDAFAGRR